MSGEEVKPDLADQVRFLQHQEVRGTGTIASSAFGNASKMATACPRVNQVVVAGHHQPPAPSPRQARIHPGPFRARPVRRSLRRPRGCLPHQPQRPRPYAGPTNRVNWAISHSRPASPRRSYSDLPLTITSGFTRSGRCMATNAPSMCPTRSAAHMRPRRVMVQGGKQLICVATQVDTAQLDHCAVQRGVGEKRPRQLRTA